MPDPALLDPALKTVLDQLAATGGPALSDMPPTEAREMYKLLATMDGGPEEVDSLVTREIEGVPCRVYRGKGAPRGPRPVLAWFHGGGWVIGDLDTADATASKLANRSGCVVVSVDYRLAPEHPFPAPLDDCWSVTRWLAEGGASSIGGDPKALAVGGDSAGGNLAAVVALVARDAGVDLRHQLLVYPVTDLSAESASYQENGDGYLLTADSMRWFIGHYTTPEQRKEWKASPLLADDLAGVCGAHVITAGFDPLRDEGDAYAARLAEAGVPVEHDRVEPVVHGFFAMAGVTEHAAAAVDRAGEILARAMVLDGA